MISRALIHGRRRAEEMREAAKTVRKPGLEPLMSAKIAERQDWAADSKRPIGGNQAPTRASLDELFDACCGEGPAPASK